MPWLVGVVCTCLLLDMCSGCTLISPGATSFDRDTLLRAANYLEDVLAFGLSFEEVEGRLEEAGYELRFARDSQLVGFECYRASYQEYTVALLFFDRGRLRHLKNYRIEFPVVAERLVWSDGLLWCVDPVLAEPGGADVDDLLQDYVRTMSRLGYQSTVYSDGWMRVYSCVGAQRRDRMNWEQIPAGLDKLTLYDVSHLWSSEARLCVGSSKVCAFATRESTRKRCRVFLRDEDIDWTALERVRAEFDRIRPEIEHALGQAPRGKRGSVIKL